MKTSKLLDTDSVAGAILWRRRGDDTGAWEICKFLVYVTWTKRFMCGNREMPGVHVACRLACSRNMCPAFRHTMDTTLQVSPPMQTFSSSPFVTKRRAQLNLSVIGSHPLAEVSHFRAKQRMPSSSTSANLQVWEKIYYSVSICPFTPGGGPSHAGAVFSIFR